MVRKSSFTITLMLSLVLHGLVALFLFRNVAYQAHSKKGVVAIDFVQSVHHTDANLSVPLKAKGAGKKTEIEKQVEAKPEQLGNPGQIGEIGDPKAIERDSDKFIGEVTKLIDRNKVYPKQAIDREEEGKVLVALTLDRNGTLLESRIEQPSPFELLNGAALQAVQKIAKFPAVPGTLSVPIHLHVPLTFRIER